MTTTDRLHYLVDALPADATETAARVLEALVAQSLALDPAARAALLAPDDDEPETEDERAGVAESLAAYAAGDIVDVAVLRAELGPRSAPVDAGA